MWSEPEPWTVAIVLATTVVIAARHPLARMIGTEGVDTGNLTEISVASAAPPLTTPEVAAPVPLTPYPTHAPRDPFRPLAGHHAKAAGTARAAVPAPTRVRATGGSTKQGDTSCAGSEHRVVSGDTLWSVAARAVHST
ncbi:MAG TPA: LysM domain-containing protein, partial [Nocardioides sp.]|nr:LysM domain-containing protein [Nocardioides sp.]